MVDLVRSAPWTGHLKPGAYGNAGLEAPVTITPLNAVSSLTVIARKGASLSAVSGLEFPGTGKWVANDTLRIASDGPGQWRIVARGKPEGELYREVRETLGDTASVSDQSHGWVTVRISGEACPDVLSKGSSIDFHLDAFGPGQCAATQIHHMMIHLTCLDDTGPTYELQLFRSMAGSFAHWLQDSAAEFGCHVE